MKHFFQITGVFISLMAIGVSVGCGGASDQPSSSRNNSLAQRLQAQSVFRVNSSNYSTLDRNRARRLSRSSSPSSASLEVGSTPAPTSTPENTQDRIEITFTDREFFVRIGTEEVLRGSWREVNETTLEVTIEGEKFYVGVDLEGDDLQIYETSPGSNF